MRPCDDPRNCRDCEHQADCNSVTVDDIFDLQEQQNQGRGVCCVRSICTYIRRKDLISAELVFFGEHDKIDSYPELEQMIAKFLGLKRGSPFGFWQRNLTA